MANDYAGFSCGSEFRLAWQVARALVILLLKLLRFAPVCLLLLRLLLLLLLRLLLLLPACVVLAAFQFYCGKQLKL